MGHWVRSSITWFLFLIRQNSFRMATTKETVKRSFYTECIHSPSVNKELIPQATRDRRHAPGRRGLRTSPGTGERDWKLQPRGESFLFVTPTQGRGKGTKSGHSAPHTREEG